MNSSKHMYGNMCVVPSAGDGSQEGNFNNAANLVRAAIKSSGNFIEVLNMLENVGA